MAILLHIFLSWTVIPTVRKPLSYFSSLTNPRKGEAKQERLACISSYRGSVIFRSVSYVVATVVCHFGTITRVLLEPCGADWHGANFP